MKTIKQKPELTGTFQSCLFVVAYLKSSQTIAQERIDLKLNTERVPGWLSRLSIQPLLRS